MARDGDDELSGDGMGYEESRRDAAHPAQGTIEPRHNCDTGQQLGC